MPTKGEGGHWPASLSRATPMLAFLIARARPTGGMRSATSNEVYMAAVLKQQRAQADFEVSEPSHRAAKMALLAKATLLVATAARELHAALDEGSPSSNPRPPKSPHRRLKQRPRAVRATTPAEDETLRQILTGDSRVLLKRSGSMEPRKPGSEALQSSRESLTARTVRRSDETPMSWDNAGWGVLAEVGSC